MKLGIVLLNDLTNHIKEHHHGTKTKLKKSFNQSGDHHGTFLSLPKNRKNKNPSSQSSSPRLNMTNINQDESGFFEEGIMFRVSIF